MCEIATVYGCDRPKARKPHQCVECYGTIQVGEKYHKHHGIWDGQALDYKVCEDCESLRSDADESCSCNEDRTCFGSLWETVFESREPKWITRFMEIKRKRGGKTEQWMLKKEQGLLK